MRPEGPRRRAGIVAVSTSTVIVEARLLHLPVSANKPHDTRKLPRRRPFGRPGARSLALLGSARAFAPAGRPEVPPLTLRLGPLGSRRNGPRALRRHLVSTGARSPRRSSRSTDAGRSPDPRPCSNGTLPAEHTLDTGVSARGRHDIRPVGCSPAGPNRTSPGVLPLQGLTTRPCRRLPSRSWPYRAGRARSLRVSIGRRRGARLRGAPHPREVLVLVASTWRFGSSHRLAHVFTSEPAARRRVAPTPLRR